jgi:NAD(P)-dependent dehydrogenase (short-subunit alcohol dehydrogenase family)
MNLAVIGEPSPLRGRFSHECVIRSLGLCRRSLAARAEELNRHSPDCQLFYPCRACGAATQPALLARVCEEQRHAIWPSSRSKIAACRPGRYAWPPRHRCRAPQPPSQKDRLQRCGLRSRSLSVCSVGATHATGTGGIINLASNSAFQPLPHMATYAAAKAFVLHFSEALKFELKGRGVQVMAVWPGPTATSFFEGVSTKMKDGALDSAELVVCRTLRSFDQKKSVAYPGRFSVRVAIWLPRLLPRNVVVSAAASATGKMGLAS